MKLLLLLAASLFLMSAGVGADKKVSVCHVPPGNSNPYEIVISENAVPTHIPLHRGDYVMEGPYAMCVAPEHN